MNVIAIVKLGVGRAGFYDELTNIHLTLSQPTAKLYAHQNLKNIKRALKSGALTIIQGSITEPVPVTQTEPKPEPKQELKPEPIPEVKPIETVQSEPVVEIKTENIQEGEPYVDSEEEIVTVKLETVNVETVEVVEVEDDDNADIEVTVDETPKPKRGRKKK